MLSEEKIQERIDVLKNELEKMRFEPRTLMSDINIARRASALGELKWVLEK